MTAPVRPIRTSANDPAPTEPYTQLGMANRLIAAHGDRLRYVATWNRWYVWDGKRWAVDDTRYVTRCAVDVARNLLHAAAGIENKDTREACISAAKRGETASAVRGAVELASAQEGIALRSTDLDADPYLVNCTNGVLDLRTGELGSHNPDLLLTKITGAAYIKDAARPTFDKFLARVQPDPEVRAYLARTLGLGLFGKVAEHLLPVLYGVGANGKSTLIEIVLTALGDYGITADPGLLIDRGNVHPTGQADLHGKRLAVTHETDAGRRLAEATVKLLTGGDRITARRMREDFWQFDPSHTVVMIGNHKPVITGTDEGIWRRIKLVPFDVVIPEGERDTELKDKLLLEATGVLAWLAGGYKDWSANGLSDPAPVVSATAEYRADSDQLGRYLTERVLIAPSARVRSSELFEDYQRWCSVEKADAGSNRSLTKALVERGYGPPADDRHGRVWHGLGLYAAEESDRDA